MSIGNGLSRARVLARVRVRRNRLDGEIARADYEQASPDHALRARQLGSLAERRRLARSLRDVVAKAHDPRAAHFDATVPILGPRVRASDQALLGIAERLERPGPLNPSGVARVIILLTDGYGPLYNASATRTLNESLWSIADGLRLPDAPEWETAPGLPGPAGPPERPPGLT